MELKFALLGLYTLLFFTGRVKEKVSSNVTVPPASFFTAVLCSSLPRMSLTKGSVAHSEPQHIHNTHDVAL
jgi:hypothetical protein